MTRANSKSHSSLPPGSSLEGSSEFVKQLEAELKALPGIRDMLTVLGADQRRQVDRGSDSDRVGGSQEEGVRRRKS